MNQNHENEEYQREIKEHYINTMLNITKLYNDGNLCDVTLICGNDAIQAHRLVLSSVSHYFYSMFNNNLIESEKREIILNDIDSQTLRILIDYIYTGKISITNMNVCSILSTASMLQLDKIITLCVSYLLKNLNLTNCITIYRYSDKFLFKNLFLISKSYILENFMQIFTTNADFYDLTPTELEQFLSDDDLNVKNEECAYECLIKWLNYNLNERLKYFNKLFQYIRLPLIDSYYLTKQIETNKLLTTNYESQLLLIEAATYHMIPEKLYTTPQTPRTMPRKSTLGYLLAVGGVINTFDNLKGVGQTIEKYDCRLDKWSIYTFMNNKRLQCGVSLIDMHLFIVGGREGLKTMNSVEYFDLEKHIWSNMNVMNTPRHGLGVIYFNGLLYATGGHDGWSFLNTVERFDLDLGVWTYIAPMLNARSTHGIAILNNRMYVIGGRDSSSCLKSVEYYNPNSNKWTLCASMSKRRGSVGVATLNGYIYAVGGHELANALLTCNRFDCAERYDPKLDQWTVIANMCRPKEAVGIAALGPYLYIAGGFDGNRYLNEVERYDPNKNEWSKVQCLNMLRAGTSLIHVKNTLLSSNSKENSYCNSTQWSVTSQTVLNNHHDEHAITTNKPQTSSSSSSLSSLQSSVTLITDKMSQSCSINNNNNDLTQNENDNTDTSFHTI